MKTIRRSASERIFDGLNGIMMFLFSLTILFPFIYVIAVSLTNQPSITLLLKPGNTVTFQAYETIFSQNDDLVTAFAVSVGRTLAGTGLNMFFTVILAYPLSRRYFPIRNPLTVFILITMLFGGGLIPSYMVTSSLKLIDSYWVYIIPGLISSWNCIILRNFLMAIPDSMEESAKLDGATDWRILFQVIVPLSLPSLATIALFYAVGHWNAWFDAVLYMRSPEKYTLQVFLRRMVMENVNITALTQDDPSRVMTPEAIKDATILVSTIPILMVYPFLQKYFVKGIMIGAIKG